MSSLPREARDGFMRAWLNILHERHPEVQWVEARALQSSDCQREGEDDLAKQLDG
jgi:hypothetical protein